MCAQLRIPLVDLTIPRRFPACRNPAGQRRPRASRGRAPPRAGLPAFGFTGFSNDGWSCERRDGFVEALRLAGRDCDIYDVHYLGTGRRLGAGADRGTGRMDQAPAQTGGHHGLFRPPGAADSRGGARKQHPRPEEVAVIGANNDPIRCELSFPPLSSVVPNAFQSGYRAAETLAEMLAGRKPEIMDQRIEPLGVVTRPSTDVLAIDDKILAAALSFIRLNACRGISVDSVARHAFGSRSQLEKKFRRHLGHSPQAEIRRVQFNKIKQLLWKPISAEEDRRAGRVRARGVHVRRVQAAVRGIPGRLPQEDPDRCAWRKESGRPAGPVRVL